MGAVCITQVHGIYKLPRANILRKKGIDKWRKGGGSSTFDSLQMTLLLLYCDVQRDKVHMSYINN